MANFNKVLIIGHLTRNPELRYAESGMALCEMGVACNRKWKAKDGADREEVWFADCKAFGRTAEVIAEHLQKGAPIFIEGHGVTESWEKDGQKKSRTRVIIDSFQFLGSKPDAKESDAGDATEPNSAPEPEPVAAPAEKLPAVSSDDIPF